MDFIKRNTKRVATDAAGYGLLLLAALTGWLPGPGGIPLALAGLGLLSINNVWAQRLRDYLLTHGGKVAQFFFPRIRWIERAYDALVVLLLIIVAILEWQRAAGWQIALGISLFFVALLLAALNRGRWDRLKNRRKKSPEA
jgi:hypothetical protein